MEHLAEVLFQLFWLLLAAKLGDELFKRVRIRVVESATKADQPGVTLEIEFLSGGHWRDL